MQYIIAFLEGIITFISPCLLPMLPIYISYFAGGGVYWKKDSISAMQYGDELDAAAIQQYFLKNYRG